MIFETMATFQWFFFGASAILLLGVIFEDKFIALEDKLTEKHKKKRINRR